MLNPSYGNSFTSKVDTASPQRVMRQIVDDNPAATPEERFELFIEAALNDPDLNRAALRAEAVNLHAGIMRLKTSLRVARKPVEPRQRKQERSTRIATMADQIKTKAVLVVLDIEIDGKQLRDHTGKELTKLGGRFTKIGKAIKPNDVLGKVMSEAAVKKLWNAK